MYQHVIASAFH